VFLVAMAPRSSTWSGTFRGPLVLLEEVDAYYHLRRIELALANDLVVPAVDTYNNHPFGAPVDWPPGFDVLLALTWHLLSQVTPDSVSPAAVGAVGVAVLGSLAAAVAAVLAARWSVWAGLVAGLAVAWSPAAVAYSRIGRLDHHAIEPLWLVVFCAVYAWSRRRPSRRRAAVLGFSLAMGTAFWPGLAFYAAVLALALALEAWIRWREVPGKEVAAADDEAPARGGAAGRQAEWERRGSAARHGTVTYLAAAATSALLALTSPWGREFEVVYYALSWFQPLIFGALAFAFGATAFVQNRGGQDRRAWAIGCVALAGVSVPVLLAGSGTLESGLDFLFRRDPVAATLLESRSLVEMGFGYALSWLTPLGVALPALWLITIAVGVRRTSLDPLLAASLALSLLAAPFTVLQMRFGPHAAVASGLLAGWLISRSRRPLLAGGLATVLVAGLAWGVRPATLPDSAVHPFLLGGFDALVWLRRAPPPTSHLRQPWRHPEYGVAAEWMWGHWITQIGQKPNIANPLGQTPRNRQGIEEVARLFLAESETEALAIIKRLDIRYLLLTSIPEALSDLAGQAGRNPDRYVAHDLEGSPIYLPPFFETFHSRLYLGGGAGEEGTEPMAGVRLAFDSRVRIDFMGLRPAVRIFEVVPGATLKGRCPFGAVEGRAELAESELVYTVSDVPDPDGAFALELPYGSEEAEASIPARITVRCGQEERVVQVSENDVLRGGTVPVGAFSGQGSASAGEGTDPFPDGRPAVPPPG